MKERNVSLFKQFLKFRGLEVLFPALYKSHRFEDSPESYEEYLQQVDAYHVIMLAFNVNEMKSNNIAYDASFWIDLNKKWLKYMKAQSDHGYYQDEIRIPRRPVKNADGTIQVPVEQQPAPAIMPEPEREQEEERAVSHDWAGLDLVPVKSEGHRQMDPPSPLEIRVCTKSGNIVVLSNHISSYLVQFGLMTMEMQVDRRSNRLVFLFGKNFQYSVRKYSTDLHSIAHKNVIETLQKYLLTKFDDKKCYYVKILEKKWNADHSQCAVVITNEFTEKDR